MNNWSTEDIKTVLGPIYTVGKFSTYNPRTKEKRVPSILQSKAFEKILTLIIDDGIRYIDTTFNGWNIKFYTRNLKYNKYEFYLNFSKNTSPIIIN